MVEILAPSGSSSSVEAAVQGGANAIYLGYGDFNARRNAKNFTLEQLEEAVDYCHVRDVSVFLTLNTLLTERELDKAVSLVQDVGKIGVDAVIVQDLGVASMVKKAVPSMELHGSTQMSVHSLDGLKELADFGFSRVVLARELGKSEIAHLAKYSPIELEVFVHGAQCMSYSGQCYLSAMVGQRSGNRGLCAQPCRLPYSWKGAESSGTLPKTNEKQGGGRKSHDGKKAGSRGGNKYQNSGCSGGAYHPMSLKDMSLIHEILDLADMGIASFKIEGRMKRAEYVYIVTKIYSDVLRERRAPTKEELQSLELAFSRQGFTQGYYNEEIGEGMFGVREEQESDSGMAENLKDLFQKARQGYEKKELRKVDVFCDITVSNQLELVLEDGQGHQVSRVCEGVEEAKQKPLTGDGALAQMSRTGNTPYRMVGREIHVAEGKAIPLSMLNQLRREMLDELSDLRIRRGKRSLEEGTLKSVLSGNGSSREKNKEKVTPPVYTVWVRGESTLTPEFLDCVQACSIPCLYVPVNLSKEIAQECIGRGISLCVQVPSFTTPTEREKLVPHWNQWKELGVTEALVGTIDSVGYARDLGFSLRGDYGLGLMNDQSIEFWHEKEAFLSMTTSFELKFPQMRDLKKTLPLEFFVYGHLPLMTTKNCMIGNDGSRRAGKKSGPPNQSCGKKCKSGMSLIDRKGEEFPVESAWGARNLVFNGLPLYLADKKEDWVALGMWAGRISFTRESSETCISILKAYQDGSGEPPVSLTRGLYYRGVT